MLLIPFQPALFKANMIRRTSLSAVPWFLMNIAMYGVGISTPTLLAGIFISGSTTNFIADDITATGGKSLEELPGRLLAEIEPRPAAP